MDIEAPKLEPCPALTQQHIRLFVNSMPLHHKYSKKKTTAYNRRIAVYVPYARSTIPYRQFTKVSEFPSPSPSSIFYEELNTMALHKHHHHAGDRKADEQVKKKGAREFEDRNRSHAVGPEQQANGAVNVVAFMAHALCACAGHCRDAAHRRPCRRPCAHARANKRGTFLLKNINSSYNYDEKLIYLMVFNFF